MATYNVTIRSADGTEMVVPCDGDTYILDAADEAELDLPYSCRAGACSSCVGRLIEGTLDQSDQSFLDEAQIKDKYALLCVAYATSDLIVKTDCEEDLW